MPNLFPQDRWVRVNGIQIHYRDWGGDGKSILLLHGLASHAGIWDLAAPFIRTKHRVIALDLRGHGSSSKPDHGYDFDTVSSDVISIYSKLKLELPVIVGHSWGGNVALHCAVSEPTHFSGVVMVDGGFIEPSSREGWTWELAEREMSPPLFNKLKLDTLKKRIKQGNLQTIWTPEIEQIIMDNFYQDDIGFSHPHLSRTNHMKIVRALWDHKPSELMPRLDLPTLVLAARGFAQGTPMDKMRENMVNRAEQLLPNGKLIWLEDTIHDVPLQRPRDLANLIITFSSGLNIQ